MALQKIVSRNPKSGNNAGNNLLGSLDYADLTLDAAVKFTDPDTPGYALLHQLQQRRLRLMPEMTRLWAWCFRADQLYYSNDITKFGADLWAQDPSAYLPGRAHLSVNTPAAYVDIPAALQAVTPVENFLSNSPDDKGRLAAANLERIYYAWKRVEQWETKVAMACTAKALYGKTAALVYWNEDEQRPCIQIIDQPKNMYLGWKSTEYQELDWAAYVTRLSPGTIVEEYGVDIVNKQLDGQVIPYVRPFEPSFDSMPERPWLQFGPAMVEVWDYWFRVRTGTPVQGKPSKMVTHRALFIGNLLVSDTEYPELEGKIPFIPLFNTYIPGDSNGRSDLYDIEQLIHEKMQRLTDMSQMISAGAAGNYFQLTGPDAPYKIAAEVKPRLNEVIAPGPGNRIETITPFIPQFQAEQYLSRLDREMATVSGLNDLLLGLAPAQVLSSSKAVSALIANYEARIAMRRQLLYKWRREVWEMVVKLWAANDKTVKSVVDAGGGWLDLSDPSLAPRDEIETANRAAQLVSSKLWSARRGMDAVGVDDPEVEQDMIREERTDATLYPADVQVEVQLLQSLQSMGVAVPQNVEQQAQGQEQSGSADLRAALGQQVPGGSPTLNQPGEQGVMPAEGQPPGPGGNAPEAPFAQAPQTPQQELGMLQNTFQNGQVKSKIVQRSFLGGQGGGPPGRGR